MHLSIACKGGADGGVVDLKSLREVATRQIYKVFSLEFSADAVNKMPWASPSSSKPGVVVTIRARELSRGDRANPAQDILVALKRKFKEVVFTVIVECQEGVFEATQAKALARS